MLASKHILIPYFSCIPKLINGVYFKITWLMTNQSQMHYFFNIFLLYSKTWFSKNWVYNSDDQASIYQNCKFHEPSARDLFCLFVCLGFLVPLEIFSLMWRRQHDRRRAGNFDLFTLMTKVFCGWDSNTPQSACSRTL